MNPQTGDVDLAETKDLPLDALPTPILIVDGESWQLDGTLVAPELLDVALADLPQPIVLHVLIARDAPATGLLEVMNTPALSDVELRLVTLRKRDVPQ